MRKRTRRLASSSLALLAMVSVYTCARAEGDKTPSWTVDFEAGKTAAAKGDSATAQADWKKALAAAERAKDDQAVAEIANNLANSYLTQGDIVNASDMAKKAKDAALRVLMADPRTAPLASQLARNEENGAVWINHMMKGEFAFQKNDYAVAQTEYQAAVDKAKEYASDGMPMATALGGLGKTLVAEEKYKEAEPVLRQAIELCQKNWTPVTKQTALDAADAMERLALVLDKTGRHDESLKIAARSKQVRDTKTLKD